MHRIKHPGIILLVIISLSLVFPQTAYASTDVGALAQATYAYYIGPGLGTLIAQVLIGLAIGGAAMVGIYRTRVKTFLTNLFARRRHDKKSGENEEIEESK